MTLQAGNCTKVYYIWAEQMCANRIVKFLFTNKHIESFFMSVCRIAKTILNCFAAQSFCSIGKFGDNTQIPLMPHLVEWHDTTNKSFVSERVIRYWFSDQDTTRKIIKLEISHLNQSSDSYTFMRIVFRLSFQTWDFRRFTSMVHFPISFFPFLPLLAFDFK